MLNQQKHAVSAFLARNISTRKISGKKSMSDSSDYRNLKVVSFFLSLVAATTFTACGHSKKALEAASTYSQNQTSSPQRPNRTLRTVEPCIELALAEATHWRAYGTATSYVEKVALNEAERDARNRLATMIKVAVEGAAQDYEQNANQNLRNAAETIGEAVMTQFVAEEIANTRILKHSIYDLSDGTIQVYVCLELRADKAEFEKKLDNTLSRNDIIGIQYDRERLIEKTSSGLEEYKKRRRQEAGISAAPQASEERQVPGN